MKEENLMLFIVITSVFLVGIIAFAATTQDTVTVTVSIANLTEITVVPDAINWTNVRPGDVGYIYFIDIKNSGSVNVSNVYVYASTLTDETTRPYGSDDASRYSAAGLVVIKNEDNAENFPYFVGRVEWNWTDDIQGADFSAINSNSLRAWGFYKNTSFEYVWAVGNGTGGFCNNTGALFAIEDDPDAGTTGTRTPTTIGVSFNGGDPNFGYFTVSNRVAFGGAGKSVCVAVSSDCTKIFIYKYDRRSGFNTCTASRTLTNPDNRQVPPGDIVQIRYVSAFVPKGIPAGNLATGTLTFVASSTSSV